MRELRIHGRGGQGTPASSEPPAVRPVFEDKVAPCNQGCPVGVDLEGCMNLLREGRVADAADLLLRENPLPAVTGRICPRPCEGVCNRARYDEAIGIRAVERFLGDAALAAPPELAPDRARAETVGVIGSGPAGLSCAYHLARLGYAVTVYEAEAEPGGVLRYAVPEYRLPRAVLAGEIERLRRLGVVFRCGVRVGRDVPFAEVERHDAVFVASGARRCRPLAVEGGDLRGVLPGLNFLCNLAHGERPDLGRRVAVVGTDVTALNCARAALRLGAEVTVIHAGARDPRAPDYEEIVAAEREGAVFEFLAAPVAAVGDEDVPEVSPLDAVEMSFGEAGGTEVPAKVTGLRCVRLRPDGDGPPPRVPGSEFTVGADSVLVAVGEDAESGFLPGEVARQDGRVRVHPLGGTSLTAVFAGGDLIAEPHTVADAIGSGKRAAVGIDHFLRQKAGEPADGRETAALRFGPQGNVSMARWREDDPVRRAAPVNDVVTYDMLNVAHFAPAPRLPERRLAADRSREGFAETNLGLAPADALAEAGRCFNCGVCNSCELCLIFCPDVAIARRADGGFEISYKYCKGCGVCAAECPRCALTMVREGA
jgi:2-oxoacid:acceptor oxidoreductase delta subunit (pyruvate/2-ketoisovalerate family)